MERVNELWAQCKYLKGFPPESSSNCFELNLKRVAERRNCPGAPMHKMASVVRNIPNFH
jgi:hypothetical protein